MNKNKLIGNALGKSLGYGLQGYVFLTVADSISPIAAVAVRASIKQIPKIIVYASKNHLRTDFSPEAILNDSIDGVFFAD